MNLSDGSINCGRRNFDGSGGNNHAVDHYNDTNYPLVLYRLIVNLQVIESFLNEEYLR